MPDVSTKNPFADSVRAMRRIADRFAWLAQSGIDPACVTVLIRFSDDLAYYEVDWGQWFHPHLDRRYRDNYALPTMPKDKNVGSEVGSVHVDENLESWHYTYADSVSHLAINAICADAARLIFRKHTLLMDSLWEGCQNAKEVWCTPAYWRDTVNEIARFQLRGTPLILWARPLDTELRIDRQWDGKPFPDPWGMTPQPSGWLMELPHICTASVQAMDVLIEWAETGICPFIDQPLDMQPAPSQSGYLGVRIESKTMSLHRDGYESPILFNAKSDQWRLVAALVKAGILGLSDAQRENIDDRTRPAWSMLKTRTNACLTPVGLEIAGDPWRLIDTSNTPS